MKISGPESIQKNLNAAVDAIKLSIDKTDISPADKAKALEAIDQTTIVASEVPNTFVYWIAVGSVGAIAIFIVLGTLVLVGLGNEVPNFLQTTLATAIGALAGMVVPTPKTGV